MITLESDALITIAVAIVSTVVSSIATWQFSKRRYSGMNKPITEKELELEKVKNQFRSEFLAFIIVLVIALGIFAIFMMMIFTASTTEIGTQGN